MSKRQMVYNLVEGQNKSMYDIIETTTNQVIRSFSGDKFLEARTFMRHLNLGGGFDGWTPTFFCKAVKNTVKPV